MKVSRKAFVTAAPAALGFLRYRADAAEFTYRFSAESPPDYYITRRILDAASKIKEDSGGRLEIQVFPNNMLGGSSSVQSQVRAGAIEFYMANDSVLAEVVPLAGITWTPFVFADAKAGYAALAGPLGKYIHGAVNRIGLRPFDRPWASGFRHMLNGIRPIVTPDDIRGLKIRVPDSAIMVALFRALGAVPSPLSPNEIYTGLQTHLVDGVELPLGPAESFKIYEVTKYFSYTNHIWTVYTIICNGDAWQRLPKNLQDIVERRIDQASGLNQVDGAKYESSMETTLKGQGMVFNNANTSAFRDAVRKAGLYAQWRQTYGEAWGLLEKAVGKLT